MMNDLKALKYHLIKRLKEQITERQVICWSFYAQSIDFDRTRPPSALFKTPPVVVFNRPLLPEPAHTPSKSVE